MINEISLNKVKIKSQIIFLILIIMLTLKWLKIIILLVRNSVTLEPISVTLEALFHATIWVSIRDSNAGSYDPL